MYDALSVVMESRGIDFEFSDIPVNVGDLVWVLREHEVIHDAPPALFPVLGVVVEVEGVVYEHSLDWFRSHIPEKFHGMCEFRSPPETRAVIVAAQLGEPSPVLLRLFWMSSCFPCTHLPSKTLNVYRKFAGLRPTDVNDHVSWALMEEHYENRERQEEVDAEEDRYEKDVEDSVLAEDARGARKEVCPHCNKRFVNLQKHIAKRHH